MLTVKFVPGSVWFSKQQVTPPFVLISLFCLTQQYGSPPSKEEIVEAGNSCPICQEELKDPIMLRACKVLKHLCQRLFNQVSVTLWYRFPLPSLFRVAQFDDIVDLSDRQGACNSWWLRQAVIESVVSSCSNSTFVRLEVMNFLKLFDQLIEKKSFAKNTLALQTESRYFHNHLFH